MEGSASKGQRITGQERSFFQDAKMSFQGIKCTPQGLATFPLPPGCSPGLTVPDGKDPLILNCFSHIFSFAP